MKNRKHHQHKYSLKSLAGMALQQFNKDAYWDIVSLMHFYATPSTVTQVRKWAKSPNWHKRVLAMGIVSQLLYCKGNKYPKHYVHYAVDVAHELLFEGLKDSHPQVVRAALYIAGHRPCSEAIAEIVAYATHPDADIRYAVTFALGHYEETASIEALIKLATDSDDDIRDWATFALGSLMTIDTPQIRECLWRNLSDQHIYVSREALVGLASRGDYRIVEVLYKKLNNDCYGYELKSAAMIADQSLYSQLEGLWIKFANSCENSYWLDNLLEAMEICKPDEIKL